MTLFRPDAVFDDDAVAALSSTIGEEILTLRRVVYGQPPEPQVYERGLEISTPARTLFVKSASDGFRLELRRGPYRYPYSGSAVYGPYDPAVGPDTEYVFGPDEWEQSRPLLGQFVRTVRAVREERGLVVGIDLGIGGFVLGCRVFADDFYITLKRHGESEELGRWGMYPEAPLPD